MMQVEISYKNGGFQIWQQKPGKPQSKFRCTYIELVINIWALQQSQKQLQTIFAIQPVKFQSTQIISESTIIKKIKEQMHQKDKSQ